MNRRSDTGDRRHPAGSAGKAKVERAPDVEGPARRNNDVIVEEKEVSSCFEGGREQGSHLEHRVPDFASGQNDRFLTRWREGRREWLVCGSRKRQPGHGLDPRILQICPAKTLWPLRVRFATPGEEQQERDD